MTMTFTFKFDEKEAQILLDSLIEMPFKKVADLIGSIQNQVREQMQAQEAAPGEAP